MGYDPSKSIYFNPDIEYLFNNEIIEYDISDAGFSLIKQYKLLPKEDIMDLEIIPKGFDRHKAVGIMQKDNKELTQKLLEKFTEIRTVFVRMNNLTDHDIISVKKDAIYTIGQCDKTKFGLIHFMPKHRYTSYIRFKNIQNLEIYYYEGRMDIKGINDSNVDKHRLYMVDFLQHVFEMLENKDNTIKRYLSRFISKYKTKNLEQDYYLEFNNMSRELNPIFNFKNIIVPIVQIVLKEIS